MASLAVFGYVAIALTGGQYRRSKTGIWDRRNISPLPLR